MATNRVLQLLRSNTLYVPSGSGADAKTAKQKAKDAVIKLTGRKDGEILLARYQETGADIKSLLCIYHANPDLNATIAEGAAKHWTFIEDASSSEGSSQALQQEINAIETAVGLGNDGTYVTPQNTNYIGKETENNSVMTDLVTLDTQVKNVNDRIDNLDKTADVQNGQVVTTVTQTNGQVAETKANVKDLQLGGYSKDANAALPIAATDTVNAAFSKVENAIAKNTVSSTDKTVTINTTGSTTDLAVNIDNATLVKNSSTGVISSDLKVLKETTNLEANVREQYKLVYGSSTTAIGEVIKVYKDSSLKEVYLGASTDTIDPSTGVITKNTVTDPQSMNFAYQLADGTYSLTKIDVSKFLTDSEFADGLQVSSGVVSVKKDTTSSKVRIAAVPSGETEGSAGDTGLVDVLTVSSNGVKVDNIQSAINYAVQNASTSLAVSAAGDNVYIDAAVDANNNKKINVTGTYGAFNTPTATNNSLSATPNGIAKAEDVATAVNTVVGNLDGSATATAASGNVFSVLTSVTETNGVISKGDEVTLAAVAKTGTAADVAVVDSNNKLTATDVEAALEEIVDKADASLNSVSAGNTGITVDSKDGNKNQTISLNISNASDNILGLDATNGGIYLSDTWDCGVY